MQKTVVLGVTGSIAAYKAAEIVSRLGKAGVCVRVILTRAGAEFITPLTLETLSHGPVVTDMFSRETPWEVEHISLAKQADCFVVAPASANFLGKAAHGVADDMLTTTLLATKAPVLVAPAMNTNMYQNPVVQQNKSLLQERGFHFIEPEEGLLACGDVGSGRLAEPSAIVTRILELIHPKRDLEGKRILVSAGPTRESLDPVRYLTNRSSGRMGYAIAQAARERGAEVTLVSGPVTLETPRGVERVDVTANRDMLHAIESRFDSCDVLIMAAAPADFTPKECQEHKIKKGEQETFCLKLIPTADILKTVAARKKKQVMVGFAAETRDLERYAKAKLEAKNLDFIAANDVSASNAGFQAATNDIILYGRDGTRQTSGLMQKTEVAHWLLDRVAGLLQR